MRCVMLSLMAMLTAGAADYHIAPDGDDTADGSLAHPWQSVDHVVHAALAPGDRVLFRRGCTWSGTTLYTAAGAPGAPVTYGAYPETGPRPIITMKAAVPTWNDPATWTSVPSATSDVVTYQRNYSSQGLSATTRFPIPAGSLASDAPRLRVRLLGAWWDNGGTRTYGSYSVLGAYIGVQARTGDPYDIEPGTLVPLTFAGSPTLTVDHGDVVSDWIAYPFDHTKTYIVSIGSVGDAVATQIAHTAYIGFNQQSAAATEDATGYVASEHVGLQFGSLELSDGSPSRVWSRPFPHEPARLWLSGTEYGPADVPTFINATTRYSYDAASSLLYVYADGNPALAYSSIEWPSAEDTVMCLHDHATLENLDLRSGRTTLLIATCSGTVIQDCAIGRDAGVNGVVINSVSPSASADDGIIRRCVVASGDTIRDTWERGSGRGTEEGIWMGAGCHRWQVYGNVVANWSHAGMYITSFLQGATAVTSTTGNRIFDNLFTAPDIEYSRGFAIDGVDGALDDNAFYRNRITDTTVGNQINAPGTRFYANIIDHMHTTPWKMMGTAFGIGIAGYARSSPHDMAICNNVICDTDEAGIALTGGSSYYSLKQHNRICNNIFSGTGIAPRDHTLLGCQLYLMNVADVGANTYQNNLFFGASPTPIFDGHDPSNQWTYTVERFNAANGTAGDVIAGNLAGDPRFADPASGDYAPLAGSPAIDAGVVLGGDMDLVLAPGSAWPGHVLTASQAATGSAPEIGAYATAGATPSLPAQRSSSSSHRRCGAGAGLMAASLAIAAARRIAR